MFTQRMRMQTGEVERRGWMKGEDMTWSDTSWYYKKSDQIQIKTETNTKWPLV